MSNQWIYIVFFLLCPLPLFGDTIYLNNMEQRPNVKVTTDGADNVEYQEEGKYEKIPSQKVNYIAFDRAPKDFNKAMKAYRKQNFTKALSYLKTVKSSRFIIYAKFYTAESYRQMGQFRKALREYKYFKEQKHRLAPKAMFQMGMVYIYQRNYSTSERTFRKLKKSNYSKYWKYKGRYGMGLANIYKDNSSAYSFAQGEFVAVENGSKKINDASFAVLKQLAISGWGLALVGQKIYKKAKKKFDLVLSESTDDEVLAGTYLGLGRMYFQMAKDGTDSKNNYKRALLSFLRVSTLYPGLKLQYAEALAQAVKCYKKMNKNKLAKYLEKEIEVRVPKWARYGG